MMFSKNLAEIGCKWPLIGGCCAYTRPSEGKPEHRVTGEEVGGQLIVEGGSSYLPARVTVIIICRQPPVPGRVSVQPPQLVSDHNTTALFS